MVERHSGPARMDGSKWPAPWQIGCAACQGAEIEQRHLLTLLRIQVSHCMKMSCRCRMRAPHRRVKR